MSEDSYEVAFFSAEEITQLDMHQSVRSRITHYLHGKSAVVA
ncbi:MAG: hypothetical protein ACRDYX_16865 [Egibacteraceae bacterium]